MTDVFWNVDRDACARDAAAAIEAVLDQRCPEMKIAFWSAVEKHYRLDTAPEGSLPAAARPDASLGGVGAGPAPAGSRGGPITAGRVDRSSPKEEAGCTHPLGTGE